jgi:hypothetical protein
MSYIIIAQPDTKFFLLRWKYKGNYLKMHNKMKMTCYFNQITALKSIVISAIIRTRILQQKEINYSLIDCLNGKYVMLYKLVRRMIYSIIQKTLKS